MAQGGEKLYRIHPAVGIARVGDADRSSDGFFFVGPEIPGIPANWDAASNTFDSFKLKGKIKPQAARFRIFEYEKQQDGCFRPVGEITLGDSRTTSIQWGVRVANRKANFCDFLGQQGARDTPLFSKYAAAQMRNRTIAGAANRASRLEMDSGPRGIAGSAAGPVDLPTNNPHLSLTTLGQLRTDVKGRLLFVGGLGRATFDPQLPGHPDVHGKPTPPGSLTGGYANNDSWFDDVCDGPIDAQITIDGKSVAAEGAWVIVAPPRFVPSIQPYRSLFDTLVDVIVREIDIPADDGTFSGGPWADIHDMRMAWKKSGSLTGFQPSFTKHIYPIFAAMSQVPRIHQPLQVQPYHGKLDPNLFDDLGSQKTTAAARRDIFRKIRDPAALDGPQGLADPKLMPATFGDYYDVANGRGGEHDPAYVHSVSRVQYAMLEAWRDGNFSKDWQGLPVADPSISPHGLDRAALENVVGGPFFPGIEAGWLIADPAVYQSPLRFSRGKAVGTAPVPGETKPRNIVIEAGVFSQQMALPWHTDFMDCAKEKVAAMSRYLAWWPVHRPDDVYPFHAANQAVPWARHADGAEFTDFKAMIDKWSTLGFVVDTGADLFEVDGPQLQPQPPVA